MVPRAAPLMDPVNVLQASRARDVRTSVHKALTVLTVPSLATVRMVEAAAVLMARVSVRLDGRFI